MSSARGSREACVWMCHGTHGREQNKEQLVRRLAGGHLLFQQSASGFAQLLYFRPVFKGKFESAYLWTRLLVFLLTKKNETFEFVRVCQGHVALVCNEPGIFLISRITVFFFSPRDTKRDFQPWHSFSDIMSIGFVTALPPSGRTGMLSTTSFIN